MTHQTVIGGAGAIFPTEISYNSMLNVEFDVAERPLPLYLTI